MKYYVNAVLFVFAVAIIYGLAVPKLISAPDTIQVFLGFVLSVAAPAGAYYWIRAVLKQKPTPVETTEEKTK